MSILITVPESLQESIEEGVDASGDSGATIANNPYSGDGTLQEDAWMLGFLAEKNGWDIEW